MTNILSGPTKEINIPNVSLGQLMYKALKESPEDTDIMIDGSTGSRITTKEALQQACGFATSLTEYQVEKGDRVAIIGETSIKLNIAAIGTVLIGAVMCPFDPLLKSFEFQHLLKITKPKLVICDNAIFTEVQDAIQKTNPQILIIVIDAEKHSKNKLQYERLIQNVSVEKFVPSGCEDSKKELVTVVCSSGTTGMPKGVALSHWSLAYQVYLFQGFINLTFLHTSYFYWISGVLTLFSATCNIFPRILVRTSEPIEALKAIQKYKPKLTMLAPTLLSAIVFHPERALYDLSSLTIIFAGGSPVQKATVDKLKEIAPNCVVVQGYGCTELGGIISKTEDNIDTMSVGILSENMKLKIVDRSSGKCLGPNEEGEIVCWSPTVMVGYYGDENATKESFDNEGWYYTGDIGKYTEKGAIYITGRAKELLKVDNHQVSPAEIEAVISTVDGVEDVGVVGISVKENMYPMALVVKREGAIVSKEQISTAVAGALSDFKQLRAGVYFIDKIPRTSTGKLKRRLLQPIADSLYNSSQ